MGRRVCSKCGQPGSFDAEAKYCFLCSAELIDEGILCICSNEDCKRHIEGFSAFRPNFCDLCGSPAIPVEKGAQNNG